MARNRPALNDDDLGRKTIEQSDKYDASRDGPIARDEDKKQKSGDKQDCCRLEHQSR